MKTRREFISLMGGAVAACRGRPGRSKHQFQLSDSELDITRRIRRTDEGISQGLSEAGYVQGKNLAIEYRWASGVYERLLTGVDWFQQGVVLIATAGGILLHLLRKVRPRPYQLYWMGADPINAGLVSSLSRPEATSQEYIAEPAGWPKEGELLRELFPTATTVACSSIRRANAQVLCTICRWRPALLDRISRAIRRSGSRSRNGLRRGDPLGVSGVVIGTDAFFISRAQPQRFHALCHT